MFTVVIMQEDNHLSFAWYYTYNMVIQYVCPHARILNFYRHSVMPKNDGIQGRSVWVNVMRVLFLVKMEKWENENWKHALFNRMRLLTFQSSPKSAMDDGRRVSATASGARTPTKKNNK